MTASVQRLPAARPAAREEDTPKVRSALANGYTVAWCADKYNWPREAILKLIDNTGSWLYVSETDTVRTFRHGDITSLDGHPAGSLEDLLTRGEKSTVARTRTLAERLRKLTEQLRETLQREDVERAAREEIARLERELAAAKARLRGNPAPSAKTKAHGGSGLPDGVSSKDVRAWAKQEGIKCSEHGRVSKDVLARYLAAQNGSR